MRALVTDYGWEELVGLLEHFGYKFMNKGGSHAPFYNKETKRKLSGLYKPHGGTNSILEYQMKLVLDHLKNERLIEEDDND